MPSLLGLLIFTFSFFAFSTQAAVWNDTREWNQAYEEEFARWMGSNAVYERMFLDSRSPYAGIRADCADAVYALRAIFAFEHSLPFAINNPSGSRGSNSTIHNGLNKWDHYGSSQKKLVAMINTIAQSVGSENLTRFDTYPIKLKNITAGGIFSYKIQAQFGKFIRHVYNIKNINPVGTFDTIYSTQAIADKGLPMTRRRDKEFINIPQDPWGFRKFKWPQHVTLGAHNLPAVYESSTEQYELAQRLGKNGFFRLVKRTVATTSETPSQQLQRAFNNTCEESVARIEYVDQALAHLRATGNRCMNYQEFDTYSTPSRDATLLETFKKFQAVYLELRNAGDLSRANTEIVAAAEAIFAGRGMDLRDLRSMCAVNYRPGVSIDLGTLWRRLNAGALSSHPNDIVELRWGERSGPKTKCKRWY